MGDYEDALKRATQEQDAENPKIKLKLRTSTRASFDLQAEPSSSPLPGVEAQAEELFGYLEAERGLIAAEQAAGEPIGTPTLASSLWKGAGDDVVDENPVIGIIVPNRR